MYLYKNYSIIDVDNKAQNLCSKRKKFDFITKYGYFTRWFQNLMIILAERV